MSVKRILHIVGKMDRAGAETMLMNLYRQIDRTKIQFDFVTFTHEAGNYDDEIRGLGGKIIPIIASNPISRMLKLEAFLKRHKEYEVIHAHMLLSNAFHLLGAQRAGVKHRISHSHNTSNGQSKHIKKIYEKWAFITNNHIATYKIACGELAAQYLFGTSKDVLILPNAVDIEEIMTTAAQSRDYIEREFGDKGIKIIQVGRLNKVKNHNFSLKIIDELRKRNIDFTLYIIGQGPLESELKEIVNQKKLKDNVRFLGVRSDITQLMASADYMIMPSLHEGFPVVLVESQAVGLSSLVSDKISAEVDLQLGLVKFLPITSEQYWVDSILEPKGLISNEQQRMNVLNLGGFNSYLNAKKLASAYLSF